MHQQFYMPRAMFHLESVGVSDDATNQYSHGVLIGNWHEDRAGLDLVAKPDPSAQQRANDARDRFTSVARASFQKQSLHEAAENNFLANMAPAVRSSDSLGQHLLFGHSEKPQEQYLSTYNAAWLSARGVEPVDPSLAGKLAAQKAEAVKFERDHRYTSSYTQAFVPPKEQRAPAGMSGPGGAAAGSAKHAVAPAKSFARSGVFTRDMNRPYRALRLRTNGAAPLR